MGPAHPHSSASLWGPHGPCSPACPTPILHLSCPSVVPMPPAFYRKLSSLTAEDCPPSDLPPSLQGGLGVPQVFLWPFTISGLALSYRGLPLTGDICPPHSCLKSEMMWASLFYEIRRSARIQVIVLRPRKGQRKEVTCPQGLGACTGVGRAAGTNLKSF